MRIPSKLNPHCENGQRTKVRTPVIVLGIAVAIALVWVVTATVWLWHNQERVVFQPPVFDAPGAVEATQVDFAAADGHRLFGYLVQLRAPGKPSTVVIALHGNADIAAWLVPWARELARRADVAVLVPEYRGYAGIEGSPTYETAGSDARGALDFARTSFPADRIVLFGHSLGTAIASDLAASMKPEAPASLVLQSPFTSALDMMGRMLVPPVPWLWQRIARVHYDTRTLVSHLECPVWVVHGTRDVVIPTRMGRQVFAAAKHPGALLIVEGAGHNDVPELGGAHYWSWLLSAVAAETPQGRS
jgi:fermentation-respiration switch protein FrsA (DUF1100 family)